MSLLNFTIRNMTRSDIKIAINWAKNEGWNPGLYDAECFFSADPNGFFIGEINNEPVASISAVKYGDTFGFIGFYIVKPEYRGQGYGIQIWHAAMKYLQGRNVGLDGVISQQDNYKKSGFNLAYQNIRYQGISRKQLSKSEDIVKLSDLPFQLIDDYDKPFFPENRTTFIKEWINQPQSYALGLLQDEKLVGYGVIRKCLIGYKIGPLFSNSPKIADSIFLALNECITPSEPIFLDIPSINPGAVTLVESYGMQPVFETARMYTVKSPELPFEHIFGVTSFELG